MFVEEREREKVINALMVIAIDVRRSNAPPKINTHRIHIHIEFNSWY